MSERDRCLAQPFDLYQRYRSVAHVCDLARKRLGRERLRILDVGGIGRLTDGEPFLPAVAFLPGDDVEVVDVIDAELPGYRCVSPEEDLGEAEYDIVISCDVLEHVPPSGRSGFVHRLVRASRLYAVLIAPFTSEEVDLAERIFHEFHLRLTGAAQPALQEHLEHGLPEADRVEGWLEEAGVAYTRLPSGHLYAWLWMMLARHYLISLPDFAPLLERVDRLYNSKFYEADQRSPSYRQVFVVARDGPAELLGDVEELFSGFAAGSEAAHQSLPLLRLVIDLLQLERGATATEHLVSTQLSHDDIVGEILPERPLQFELPIEQDGFNRIDLLLATYDRPVASGLHLRVERRVGDRFEKVASVRLPRGAIQNNRWHTFRFPPCLESAGERFRITVEAPIAEAGHAPTAYCDSDGFAAHRAYCQLLGPVELRHSSVGRLTRSLAEREAEVEALQGERQTLEEQRARLEKQLEQWKKKVGAMEEERAERTAECEATRGEAMALHDELKQMRERLTELEAGDRDRDAELSRLHAESGELARRLEQTEKHLAALISERDRLAAELETAARTRQEELTAIMSALVE